MNQPNADYQKKREQWRKAIRKDTRLTPAQRLVLTALDEYRNSIRDDAYPTNGALAEACGMERKVGNRAVNKAEELGYLVAVKRPRRPDGRQGAVVWKFLIPPEFREEIQSTPPGTLDGPEYPARDSGKGSRVPRQVHPEYPARYREPLNEPPNKDKPVILTEDQKRMLGFYS